MSINKFIKEWKWIIFAFLALFLFGFGLRFLNLTLLPIFVDEAIYVRWAQIMSSEPSLRFLPLSDGKQPLYMWILMFLINHFEDPLFAGRFLSLLSGMGTAAGIFIFSYFLFSNKFASVVSSLFYVLSPFSFFFDRMALVDSMLSMFLLWTAIFAYLTLKYKRLDFAMISGIFLGFASLTKSSSIFVAALLPIFGILILIKSVNSKKNFTKEILQLFSFLSVIYFLAFSIYNIQRLGPNFNLLKERTMDYVRPLSSFLENPLDPFIPHMKDYFIWVYSMFPLSLGLIFLMGVYFGLKKYFWQTISLLVFVLVPVLVQAQLGVTFTARYVYFTMPYFFMISGLIVLSKSRWQKIFLGTLFLIFFIQSFNFIFNLVTNPERANFPRGERSGYLEEWTTGQGIKEISEYLKTQITEPQTKIVVGTEGYFGTLPDGLQIYLNNIPQITIIGVGVIIEEIPKSLLDSFKSGNKTYLLVNKSRFRIENWQSNLKLIKSYPKADRPLDSDQYAKYGSREELLFFELTK